VTYVKSPGTIGGQDLYSGIVSILVLSSLSGFFDLAVNLISRRPYFAVAYAGLVTASSTAMDNESQQSEVMDTLREIHHTQSQLLAAVEALSDRLERVEATTKTSPTTVSAGNKSGEDTKFKQADETPALSSDAIIRAPLEEGASLSAPAPASPGQRSALTSRIILTLASTHSLSNICLYSNKFRTYPKQIGINPLPMKWGNFDPLKRGPVVVSRSPNTIRRRNGT
jgi:hypothetical protein